MRTVVSPGDTDHGAVTTFQQNWGQSAATQLPHSKGVEDLRLLMGEYPSGHL